MKKYYYSTNGDGTTCGGFRPFENGDRAEAPDWNPDPGIECGQALHVSDLKIGTLAFVKRVDPVIYEVEVEDLLPKHGGKYRCKALTRVREVEITEDDLKKGLEDENWSVREAVCENPNATEDILKKGLEDENCWVREAVCRNPNATEDMLKKGLEDENCWVREAVCENPNATKEILEKGLEDEDGDVRWTAKERLDCLART